jgi:hypothetical protein
VYTRERKHIVIKWSMITCLALPLAAAQSPLRFPKQLVPSDSDRK